MAVIELTDDNFADELAKAEFAVVDFYAGWCGPCRLFSPQFKRVSGEYPNVTFFKVDAEKAPLARATVEIPNLPYVGAYRAGQLVEGVSTAKDVGLRNLIKRALDLEPAP